MLIQTERAIIKFPNLNDLDDLFTLITDEDISTQNFNKQRQIPKGIIEKFLKEMIQKNSEENDIFFFAGIYGKNRQQELIGFISNKEAGSTDSRYLGGINYELSYALRRDYRNKGLMTEVLLAITNFMKAKNINIVAALVMPGNVQSERTLLKAGFDILMCTLGRTAFYKRLDMPLKKYAKIFQHNGIPKNEEELNLLNRAIKLTNNENYYQAIEVLEKLLKQNENILDAYTYLAFSEFKTGNIEIAKNNFDKAVLINKYDFNIYYHRGIMYDQLSEYDCALSDYSMGIELFYHPLDDQLKDMYFNRAIIYIDEGIIEKAMSDIENLEKLGDPEVDKLYRRLRNPFQ